MKWSFATVGIILIGLIGVSIIILFQQLTTNNENDYYLLKEITEAAMLDSIDLPYYRETGNLKIVKEKFVENFTRRFAESTIFVTNDYKINFYDIMETPPKVSIVINTGLGEVTIGGNADEYGIANKLDAILEYTGDKTYVSNGNSCYGKPYEKGETYSDDYYAILSDDVTDLSLNVPDKLIAPNIKNIEIKKLEYSSVVTSQGGINEALLRNEIYYNNVNMNINNYLQSASGFSKNIKNVKLSFYNCDNRTGQIKNTYDCSNNKYYVSINGDFSNKIVIKYKVTWSYDEYEFSN